MTNTTDNKFAAHDGACRRAMICEATAELIETASGYLRDATDSLAAPGADRELLEIGDDIALALNSLQTCLRTLVMKRDAEIAFRDACEIDWNYAANKEQP